MNPHRSRSKSNSLPIASLSYIIRVISTPHLLCHIHISPSRTIISEMKQALAVTPSISDNLDSTDVPRDNISGVFTESDQYTPQKRIIGEY